MHASFIELCSTAANMPDDNGQPLCDTSGH